jgi:hypothetical protein
MDVFFVGRIRKFICYITLLGGTMVLISPLSKASCSKIPTSYNNFENGHLFNGTHLGFQKGHVGLLLCLTLRAYDLSPSF